MRKVLQNQSAAPRRYLGIELAGAKNPKTALAAIEYYPKESKIFLLDVYDRISGHDEQSGDDALLEVVQELQPGIARVGVNVPLSLPPCITCTRTVCPRPDHCSLPAVKWMRTVARKAALQSSKADRVKHITPYTQRPVELWVRHQLLPKLRKTNLFEVDEALGGTKAPLTGRMHFLKRHFTNIALAETWPKLTIAVLSTRLNLEPDVITAYRELDEGAEARSQILEVFANQHGVFIYERDQRKLAQSLAAFDAFFCAYTALLCDAGMCAKSPAGFPEASGWIEYPELTQRQRKC